VVRIVSFGSTLLVAGGVAAASVSFAGLAAAEPACQGGVPSGSSHQPFPAGRGPTGSGSCADALDSSDTSMTDIAAAGSYPNGSAVFTYSPQGTT
jgi:hypothetical protein